MYEIFVLAMLLFENVLFESVPSRGKQRFHPVFRNKCHPVLTLEESLVFKPCVFHRTKLCSHKAVKRASSASARGPVPQRNSLFFLFQRHLAAPRPESVTPPLRDFKIFLFFAEASSAWTRVLSSRKRLTYADVC
jgi:hypothetical protein